MTIRAPVPGPGRGDWRLGRHDINEKFIDQCVRLWDDGLDTAEIAKITFQHESVVETATRLGRERRRQEK